MHTLPKSQFSNHIMLPAQGYPGQIVTLIYVCECASSLIRRFRAEQRKICISESQFDLPETSPLLTFLFSTKYSILITHHLGPMAPSLPGSRKWPTTTAKSRTTIPGWRCTQSPWGLSAWTLWWRQVLPRDSGSFLPMPHGLSYQVQDSHSGS